MLARQDGSRPVAISSLDLAEWRVATDEGYFRGFVARCKMSSVPVEMFCTDPVLTSRNTWSDQQN